MNPSELQKLEQTPRRPRLTAAAESVLRCVGCRSLRRSAEPLRSVPRRLLVVKVHGLGDSVLIRLIVEQLRARHPGLHIGILAGPATREILTLGTDFRVHSYNQKELSALSALSSLREIRREGYEAVLNFEQASVAGTAFIACAGVPIHIGFVPMENSPKAMLLTHPVRFEPSRSMWQSFVALTQIADPGIMEDPTELALPPGPECSRWILDWWQENVGADKRPVVAFHLGCAPGMDFKRWPLDRFASLADELRRKSAGVIIILTGTAVDKPLIREFIEIYRGRTVDASGLGSIERTLAILKRCQLLVSIDTGVMHLGAALGVPTVGLFGPTSPRYWGPIGSRATHVYDTHVSCSPCVNNYLNQMPSRCGNPDQERCMRDIATDAVLASARRVVIGDWLA